MESINPYQSPQVANVEQGSDVVRQSDSFESIARRTFWDWEKLRLVFNGVLVVWTLCFANAVGDVLTTDNFWILAIAGGLIANVCFFAGPIVETYVAWLGFRTQLLRGACFAFGTVLVAIVAAAAIEVVSGKFNVF